MFVSRRIGTVIRAAGCSRQQSCLRVSAHLAKNCSSSFYESIDNELNDYGNRVENRVQSISVQVTCSRAAGGSRQKHSLPELPYEYSALEPVISREIMSLHHSKHHATYVNNLNAAEEKLAQAQSKGDIQTVISLGPGLKFNGGGHINHTIFWQNLSPKGGKPSDQLTKAIEKDFGSWENMKNQLAASSVGVQGSGWGWLGYNKQMKKLQIATCLNQDPLEATTGLIPLFGIDVWEHAYYLQYKNVRADYVKAIFDVANWKDVSARYETASAK